jgi:hypothetical protein
MTLKSIVRPADQGLRESRNQINPTLQRGSLWITRPVRTLRGARLFEPQPGRPPWRTCALRGGPGKAENSLEGQLRRSLARFGAAHFSILPERGAGTNEVRGSLWGCRHRVGMTRRPRGARRGSPDPAGSPDRQVSRAHRRPRFQRCSCLRSLLQTKETYRSSIWAGSGDHSREDLRRAEEGDFCCFSGVF